MQDRVKAALDKVRPNLQADGGEQAKEDGEQGGAAHVLSLL